VPDAAAHLPDADTAARLDRDAAAWPEVALDPVQLSDLELRLVVPDVDLPPLEVSAPVDLAAGDRLALRDGEGVLLADLTAAATVRTGEPVLGALRGVRLPAHPDAAALRRTPAQLRTALEPWDGAVSVLATDRPLFTADLDHVADVARSGGVVVALLAGGVAPTDPAHHARVAALRAGLAELPPEVRDRVQLTVLPLPGTADEDLLRAVLQAYGLRGDVTRPPLAGSPGTAEIDGALDAEPSADRSGSPGVGPAAVLQALRRVHPPRSEQGLTVFFTGLSGSGKSTVAGLLVVRLLERTGRSVLLLDGDRVRRHLTKGLGFSREDRDTNVLRIGWVAAQVSAAGGIAVCAPIAPYDATRRTVRATVEGVSPRAGFVLVHVATPLEECERRDRKGLYARARAGELPGFTGISDPYEVPEDAELTVDTTDRTPDEVVDEIIGHLTAAGRLRPDAG
jgi:sulfate adenylyltransferase